MQNDSSLRQATQRDPGTMTPEDDYHVISTATPAPAAGSQGRSWELLLITQHSPVMAFRDTIHYWLSQWKQKGLPGGQLPLHVSGEKRLANISTADTSSLGNHLRAVAVGAQGVFALLVFQK